MKLLGIKAFLRGGYREQTQPVLVVSHARPAGIWIPVPDKSSVNGQVERIAKRLEQALQNDQ